jgi:Domain of unknown function (DUF397)
MILLTGTGHALAAVSMPSRPVPAVVFTYNRTYGDNRVEVGVPCRAVAVRDSKDPHGPVLSLAPEAWRAFTGQVKNGSRDLT